MTVVLDERLLPMNSNLDEIHLNSWSEGCTAQVFDNYHIELSTRFDSCGTTLREDEDNIIFRNLITFEKPGAKDSGAVITREYHKQIQVECCLSKVSILAGQFQPQISKIDIEDKELGMFSLRIARFTDFSFDVEKSVGDEGVVAEDRVMLGSEICFGVVLDSTPIVGVVIKSCWATEGGPDDVPPREDLINDQCPAEQSVRVNHMVSRDIEGFCFSAFRFRDEESDMSQVFIHCDVMVCDIEEADAARSDVSCAGHGGGERRRRDASSGSSQHTISYGPLSIFSQGNGFAASVQGQLTYYFGGHFEKNAPMVKVLDTT
nr:ZP domain-containing protein-like [Lytechinus pictus]